MARRPRRPGRSSPFTSPAPPTDQPARPVCRHRPSEARARRKRDPPSVEPLPSTTKAEPDSMPVVAVGERRPDHHVGTSVSVHITGAADRPSRSGRRLGAVDPVAGESNVARSISTAARAAEDDVDGARLLALVESVSGEPMSRSARRSPLTSPPRRASRRRSRHPAAPSIRKPRTPAAPTSRSADEQRPVEDIGRARRCPFVVGGEGRADGDVQPRSPFTSPTPATDQPRRSSSAAPRTRMLAC